MPSQIPQVAAAQAAAKWIVSQQAADGSIGGIASATANGLLALAAAHDEAAAAQSALSYHGDQRRRLHQLLVDR